MDHRQFQTLLVEGPNASLLAAVDGGQDHRGILPLLEAELHRSARRLQRLKEYRNSLASPIYRLLPELISTIFYVYAQDNGELFDLGWTRLLLVCRRWYHVAMTTQTLWSFIQVYGPQNPPYIGRISYKPEAVDDRERRRLETQRSRAGLSPLTVNLSLYSPMSSTKLALSTVWDPALLCSLSIAGIRPNLDKAIRSLVGNCYAILQTFSIHAHDPPRAPPGALVAIENQAPLDLDAVLGNSMSNMARLKCLTISGNLSFNWASLRGLRTLKIIYKTRVPMGFTSLDVVDALSRCPEMEEFTLDLPYAFHPDVSISANAIALPRLHTLILKGAYEVCTDYLERLNNRNKSLRVVISTSQTTETPPMSTLASRMCEHLDHEAARNLRSILVTSMTIHGGYSWGIPGGFNVTRIGIVGQKVSTKVLKPEPVHHWFDAHSTDPTSFVGLEVEVPMEPMSAREEVITRVLHSWPLSNATHLDLRQSHLTTSHLEVLLESLPGLTTVIVGPGTPNALILLRFLYAQLRDYGRRVVGHIIFDSSKADHPIPPHPLGGAPPPPPDAFSRNSIIRTLIYCTEAARIGAPLDTVEIINEAENLTPWRNAFHILDALPDTNWSELYTDLAEGFVYEGILHSSRSDLDGSKTDSFASTDNPSL